MMAEQKQCIGDSRLQVTVSTKGGELQSIRTADGYELLWQGDTTYWSDRAPNLFPYVGRLWDNAFYLGGETFSMAIHGFIHQQQLQVETHTADSLALVFHDTAETRACYPYRFVYAIDYQVINGCLAIVYRVTNQDDRPMYFGIGGHPGFRVPLESGISFEDYYLQFEDSVSPIRIGFSEQCFRDRNDRPFPLNEQQQLPLSHSLFDQDAIVLKECGHTVSLRSRNGKKGVVVSFPDMPYLGIWHRPHTDAPYVCLEPWASLPSMHGQIPRFEEQPDLIAIQPGQTYVNRWWIRPVTD